MYVYTYSSCSLVSLIYEDLTHNRTSLYVCDSAYVALLFPGAVDIQRGMIMKVNQIAD